MSPQNTEFEAVYPVAVTFRDTSLLVELADSRSIATPLAWYPRLARASDAGCRQ